MQWTPQQSIWMRSAVIVQFVSVAQISRRPDDDTVDDSQLVGSWCECGPRELFPGAGFGGPASPPVQLRTDQADGPTFRFPGLDRPFDPWMKVKKRLAEHRFLLGGDYNILYQNDQ